MELFDFITKTDLKSHTQAEQAALLCYFDYKTNNNNIFDSKAIQGLFSDAGCNTINVSRVKLGLINLNLMRVSKEFKQAMEFAPAKLQEYELNYSSLWEDTETIKSNSEVIDETKFGGKRNYLTKLIKQINHTYANNCYDATAVLMRRLFEILLILSYQTLGIDDEIKDKDNQGYLMLDQIVKNAENNKTLKISRTKNKFEEFRKVGNFSAHKIEYTASKKDIDDIKLDYRAMVEELYNKAGLLK